VGGEGATLLDEVWNGGGGRLRDRGRGWAGRGFAADIVVIVVIATATDEGGSAKTYAGDAGSLEDTAA
jgi:hypothetical protein